MCRRRLCLLDMFLDICWRHYILLYDLTCTPCIKQTFFSFQEEYAWNMKEAFTDSWHNPFSVSLRPFDIFIQNEMKKYELKYFREFLEIWCSIVFRYSLKRSNFLSVLWMMWLPTWSCSRKPDWNADNKRLTQIARPIWTAYFSTQRLRWRLHLRRATKYAATWWQLFSRRSSCTYRMSQKYSYSSSCQM